MNASSSDKNVSFAVFGPLACGAVDTSVASHSGIWGVGAVFAILVGYAFATAGYRLFKITTVLTSFIGGFAAAAPLFMLAFGPSNIRSWLVCAAVVGAAFAFVGQMYVRAATCAIGSVAGAFVALRLWTVVPMSATVGTAVVTLAACVCGPLVSARVTRPLLIVCTALYGVLMTLAGAQILAAVFTGGSQSVCSQQEAYAVASAVLAPLAAVLQFTGSDTEQTEAGGAYGVAPDDDGSSDDDEEGDQLVLLRRDR